MNVSQEHSERSSCKEQRSTTDCVQKQTLKSLNNKPQKTLHMFATDINNMIRPLAGI